MKVQKVSQQSSMSLGSGVVIEERAEIGGARRQCGEEAAQPRTTILLASRCSGGFARDALAHRAYCVDSLDADARWRAGD